MSTTTDVRERPILFSVEMVRAILAERKTQTRRVVRTPMAFRAFYTQQGRDPMSLHDAARDARVDESGDAWFLVSGDQGWYGPVRCPYGRRGDRLWVREAWSKGWTYAGEAPCVFYRADMTGWIGGDGLPVQDVASGRKGLGLNGVGWVGPGPHASAPSDVKWRPSIYMPRWASRITLEVTDVRVERLQEISTRDIGAEGINLHNNCAGARNEFVGLWDSINAKRGLGWEENPWCWCISFRRVA